MTPKQEAALAEVLAAWTDEGPVPVYHQAIQAQLRKAWPVLAEALDHLAQASDNLPGSRE